MAGGYDTDVLPENAASCLSSTSLERVGKGFSLGLRFVNDKDHFLSDLSSSEQVPPQSSMAPSSVDVGTG
jgi:hypothetical protein